MIKDFVNEEEALAASLASRVIVETIDKKLEKAKEKMNGKNNKKKCRRISVPLRLRLFSDQLRRKAEQCLEAQARAADFLLRRELEAFFGATSEGTEEVDARSEGIPRDGYDNDEEMEDDVDGVWGHNDRSEQEQQQQASKEGDEDEAIFSNTKNK